MHTSKSRSHPIQVDLKIVVGRGGVQPISTHTQTNYLTSRQASTSFPRCRRSRLDGSARSFLYLGEVLRRRPEPADRTYHIAQSHTQVARLTSQAYSLTHTRIKITTPAARNGIALPQTAAAAHRMPNGSSPMIRPGGKPTRASPQLDTGKL